MSPTARPAAPDGAGAVDAIVIGAGWGGLAAAVELARAGLRPHVLEAAPTPGGRARTLELTLAGEPVELDNGQHLLIGAYRECLRLSGIVGVATHRAIDRSGHVASTRSGSTRSGSHHSGSPRPAALERHRLALRSTDGIVLEAARLPAPLHLLAGIAGARGLYRGDRLAMLRLMLALRLAGWTARPGETVDALLARLRQPEALRRRVWEPLAIAALNTPSSEACAATFAAVLRDALGADARASDFILPTGGLGDAFPEPAVRWLASQGAGIHLRTPARGLQRDDDGWRVETDGGPLRARGLVIATPAPVAARLLDPLAALPAHRDAVDRMHALSHEPIATVYLAWRDDGSVRLPAWSMLVEDSARGRHGQWLFDRGTQRGLRLAAVVVSARGRLPGLEPRALAEGIDAQVAEQLGVARSADRRCIVEKRATFRCTPQARRVTHDAFAVARGAPPAFARLYLAGDHAWPEYPATLEAAARSGVAAGRALAGALAPPR